MTWKDLKFAENLLSSFFQLKYESSIHNIAFFSENAISSESREKYAQIKHKQKPLKQYVSGFWCEKATEDDFFYWESKKRKMLYYGLIFWLESVVLS